MNSPFFVVDTNLFISANLIANSISSKAYDKVLRIGKLAVTDMVVAEYAEVLYRKKLDKYLNEKKRVSALKFLKASAVFFNITETINICRDPKDNMFLELAVACHATCIISGDPDLLILHPYRNIPIINPNDFYTHFNV